MIKRLMVPVICMLSLAAGWYIKSYQDRNDLRPKFKIGQKITINAIEQFVDDGQDTPTNRWYREKKQYLSNGKAYIAGIEWWPTKNRQQFSYWIGSTNPEYRCFDGHGEEDITGLKP